MANTNIYHIFPTDGKMNILHAVLVGIGCCCLCRYVFGCVCARFFLHKYFNVCELDIPFPIENKTIFLTHFLVHITLSRFLFIRSRSFVFKTYVLWCIYNTPLLLHYFAIFCKSIYRRLCFNRHPMHSIRDQIIKIYGLRTKYNAHTYSTYRRDCTRRRIRSSSRHINTNTTVHIKCRGKYRDNKRQSQLKIHNGKYFRS